MLLQYLTASIFIAQGLGHSLGFLAGWTNLPTGFRDRPWLFSSGVHYNNLPGRLFGLLWLASGLLFVFSGFELIFNRSAWLSLALAAAGLSLLAILPWWRTVNPGPKHMATLVDVLVLSSFVVTALLGG